MKTSFSPAAVAAIDSLSPEDQNAVIQAIDRIANLEQVASGQTPNVHKLKGKFDYYSLRVSSDLRVVFQLVEDRIIILDVVRYSTVEKLLRGSARNNNEVV